MKFLALLRGINVGGNNIILKDDLRQCFESMGFQNVRTYIQSGNILFRSSSNTEIPALTQTVEQGLSRRFSYKAQAVVLSHEQYIASVQSAPDGWGRNEQQKHNAMFTLACTTPEKLIAELPPPKQDIETVTAGSGVVFWSVEKKHLTKATMMKLPSLPAYKTVTVRNHNTVFKLLNLLSKI